MPRSKNDGAASTMPSSLMHCRVATEFDIFKCFTLPQNFSKKFIPSPPAKFYLRQQSICAIRIICVPQKKAST
ncbi:MAG: hypothetical protein CW341_00205 [Bacteroidetes bacterium]|nr:hypothetical protein [Bacteroidota bacterium]